MQIYWLTLPAIVFIYLGFASLQGSLIHWLSAELSKDSVVSGIGYTLLIFLPVSISLPLPLWLRIVVWISAIALIFLFATRPIQFPAWVWSMRFALRYSALMMLLIFAWSVSGHLSAQVTLAAIVAGAAGILAWGKSRQFIE
ncbi:MAG: hypothetical protein N2C13_05835 [Chloroflexota bacterium]